MAKCVDCAADTSKAGWSQVPGKGELCNPCHEKWMKEKEDAKRPAAELPSQQP